MATEAAQSTASSSTTLWAQASKEWVIPAKPKPGRKPKKDAAPSNETKEQTDSKGRRVQNRAAQRAFRERKQSQLAELQARVQSYEQGEVERNVALQQISKRLKEENEQLKAENDSLKEEIARLRERVASTSTPSPALPTHHDKWDKRKGQKRWREETIGPISGNDTSIILEPDVRKRFRPRMESPPPSTSVTSQYGQLGTYLPSSPSVASSPDSNGVSRSPFSPLPFAPLPHASGSGHASSSYSTSAALSSSPGDALKAFDTISSAPPFDAFDCGLCNENTPCVCRELAMQCTGSLPGMSSLTFANDYSMSQDKGSATLKVEDNENRMNAISNIIEIPPALDGPETSAKAGKSSPPEIAVSYQHSTPVRQNILSEHHNNKGPYQIRLPSPEPTPSTAPSSRSVPLRLKNKRRSGSGKVWQLESPSPMCSGDPSNCPACKDDDFGKAFCRALGDSASTGAPACASCPNPEACGKTSRSADAPESSSSSVPGSTSAIDGPKVFEVASLDRKQATHSPQATTSRDSPKTSGSSPSSATPVASVSFMPEGKAPKLSETIPANEAWARLKSHPNIAFADLSMLADVVARRTKCSGPVAVIHPAPGSVTPERDAARSPVVPDAQEIMGGGEPDRKDKPILLTDPHAHFRAQEQQRTQVLPVLPSSNQSHGLAFPDSRVATSSALSLGPRAIGRPALVPQEELRECGRRRIREVDAAGVREALRILDAQFGKHT